MTAPLAADAEIALDASDVVLVGERLAGLDGREPRGGSRMGAGVAVGEVARRAAPNGALRFAVAVALSGAALFLVGMLALAGSWSVSVGALCITFASITGVIAMEGREEQIGSSPPPVLDRPLSLSS